MKAGCRLGSAPEADAPDPPIFGFLQGAWQPLQTPPGAARNRGG